METTKVNVNESVNTVANEIEVKAGIQKVLGHVRAIFDTFEAELSDKEGYNDDYREKALLSLQQFCEEVIDLEAQRMKENFIEL